MRFDEKLAYEDTIHYLKLENKQLGRELREAKAELVENDAIIKKQNRILLHINAELEAIKQHNPFDLVFITYSIENISNVINGQTEPIIDEECVGCCKVVDVAAKLQKELDASRGLVASYKKGLENRDEIIRKTNAFIEQQKTTINGLKDQNIEDLKELYDLYEDELRGIKADRTSIKSDRDIMFRNYRNTVAKLQGDIGVLEAELSARKEDSRVLMKVVEIVKNLTDGIDDHTNSGLMQVYGLIKDYLDAPEGPPETPKEDPEVKTTAVEIEIPVDASRTIHLQQMCIDDQSETITRLVEEVKRLRTGQITATYAFLELP